MDPTDPGWRPALRKIFPAALYLPLGMRLSRRNIKDPPITFMRGILLAAVVDLLLFASVLRFVQSKPTPGPGWYPYLVVGSFLYGVGVIALINRARPRVATPEQALAWYRSRFFIGLGVSYATPLVGFVGVFITGRYWVYVLALALGLPMLLVVAPTADSVRRAQDRLASVGVSVDLWGVLTRPPIGSR